MSELILFIFLLLIIFILKNSFGQSFFGFWFLLTRSKQMAMRLTAFFLFPGTLIHELSHYLTASVLGVATGEIKLMPEVTERGIKMGSVGIGQCGFVRRNLIGLAPLIVGLGLIYGLSLFLPREMGNIGVSQNVLFFLLIISLIFLISNSMFSSARDLEALVPLIVSLLIIYGIGWSAKIEIEAKYWDWLEESLAKFNQVFIWVIGINLGFLGIVKGLTWVSEKTLGRRVRYR